MAVSAAVVAKVDQFVVLTDVEGHVLKKSALLRLESDGQVVTGITNTNGIA